MKKIKFGLLFLSLIFSVTVIAQPGGFPGGPPPGGRPGGGRPEGGFPRGERFDRNMRNAQEKGQTVKQKKVRSGSTFKVVGTLIDSTKNEPLGFGNVAVLDKEDSSLVRGAATDLYGYFEVTEVPAGEYFLRASYIGYSTRYIPIKVENNTALGNINLREGSLLKTVTVKAQRPLYAMDGEKMIYNVADDPSIQTGTTNDALQNAPGVEVDVEGNVTLRGVSSVEIWINDKPSKLTEENLKTYLETLPANALDRIEAITNPSAKYATDAEAIINIITSAHIKKNHFISFGLNAATQPNVSPWLSYTWANERLSINFFSSLRYSTSQ
ncbi:MAG: TonB-dependent receptor, partial [Bacteroidales bacterium]|nr:TonB-dependent receptor [Bacteroidales bacterium]